MNTRIGILAIAALLAGCSGGGSSTPNNPSSSAITLETASGAVVPNTVVTLSTGISNSNVPTGVITTETTNSQGVATFTNLPSQGLLCVSATFVSNGVTVFAGQCFQPFPSTYTLE
jgi:ABC-type Fe3+-hydroxamate transport system substrate-binding protein